ncbi:MAG TPA: S24 family peptidase [Bryobacteraceae bacterium]|nr:S24 family peptidase [Bryobacteraceae bacterium]
MSASAGVGVVSTSTAQYVLLTAELSKEGTTTIGILLVNPERDQGFVRIRRDWGSIADDEEAEVLSLLEDDLRSKALEMGAEHLLAWLEENASNAVQVTARESVIVEDFERGLNRLYRRFVQSNVVPFRTHLPLYSLRAAAGMFLENEPVEAEGWVEAPADLRLLDDMFVATIVGHSMEPRIPDGALCVFRAGVAGSRQGHLVLVENRETSGNNRYTVKRYRSEKTAGEMESWRHGRIRLESLNPEYPSWDLDPDEERYRIVGEFLRVLE